MSTTSTRRSAATLAMASAVAAGLTIVSAIAPTATNAHRPDPLAGTTTQCVGSIGGVEGAETVDIAEDIAHRKAEMAQDYVDVLTLHERAAR